MVVRITDIVEAADTGDQGHAIYLHILDLASRSAVVSISFSGIVTATSSFINAAFVEILDVMPFEEFKRRIKIIDSNRQINEMIKMRVQNKLSKQAA